MYWLSSSLYFFFQQMRRKQLTFIISLSYILNFWRSLWLKHGNPLITTSNQQNGINIKFLYFYTCNIKTIISWYIAKGNQNCIDRRYATNVIYFGQNWLILKIFFMLFTIENLPLTSLSIYQRYSQSLSNHSCGHTSRRCSTNSKSLRNVE